MNKRQKKKRLIDQLFWAVDDLRIDVGTAHSRINDLEQENADLRAMINHLSQEIVQCGAVIGRNARATAQATNDRFAQLESENKALRVDLDKAIVEFKKPKRSLFGRK